MSDKMTSDIAIRILNEYDALFSRVCEIKELMLDAPVQFYESAMHDECVWDIGIKDEKVVLYQTEDTSRFPLRYLDMDNDEIVQDLINYDTAIKDKEKASKEAKEELEREERYKTFLKLKREFMPDD